MDPKIWGPHGWFFMHSITLAYPDSPSQEDKDNIRNFFINAGNVLPCYKCRINFKKHITKHPLNDKVLSSRESLVKWLIDVHNEVNELTHKPKMTYEEVMNFYIDAYKKPFYQTKEFDLILVITLIIFLLILIYVFLKVLK